MDDSWQQAKVFAIDGYKQALYVPSTCIFEKKEPYALGIFREISSKRFLATIIVLCDVFNAIQSLNVVLQKDGGSLFFADIPMYLERRSID